MEYETNVVRVESSTKLYCSTKLLVQTAIRSQYNFEQFGNSLVALVVLRSRTPYKQGERKGEDSTTRFPALPHSALCVWARRQALLFLLSIL
eukprot:1108-Rhodomonas_salina.3